MLCIGVIKLLQFLSFFCVCIIVCVCACACACACVCACVFARCVSVFTDGLQQCTVHPMPQDENTTDALLGFEAGVGRIGAFDMNQGEAPTIKTNPYYPVASP